MDESHQPWRTRAIRSDGVNDDDDDEVELDLRSEMRSARDGTGETRKTLSWIWLMEGVDGSTADSDEVLRSEWSKSRARAKRATEEVHLLREEMCRALKFLEWRSYQDKRRGR